MGAIHYYEKERVFKLDTPHTSYLIGIVDEEKFLAQLQQLKDYVENEPDDIRSYIQYIVPTYSIQNH